MIRNSQKSDPISFKKKLSYSLPAAALAVIGIPIYVYLPKFYTDIVGINVVDHDGYILSNQDQHSITLMYVENGASLDANIIFERSHGVLKEHGISADRIDRETTWGINVPGAIMNCAEKNGFAALTIREKHIYGELAVPDENDKNVIVAGSF